MRGEGEGGPTRDPVFSLANLGMSGRPLPGGRGTPASAGTRYTSKITRYICVWWYTVHLPLVVHDIPASGGTRYTCV